MFADRTGNNFHPSEKPVDLIQKLLMANEGDTVMDCFMGAGATLLAAKNLGRQATGIELSLDYCNTAKARLAQGVFAL